MKKHIHSWSRAFYVTTHKTVSETIGYNLDDSAIVVQRRVPEHHWERTCTQKGCTAKRIVPA